jgi:hypothetical protein
MIRALACALACLFVAGGANAQSAGSCPVLAADSGLRWEQLEGPDFTFCKAIRADDGSQAFAVMLGRESPFRPNRADRAEESMIDGHDQRWYRSEVASNPDAIIRETLVELGRDRVAHITLHADNPAQKEQAMRQIEALRFQPALLSSN